MNSSGKMEKSGKRSRTRMASAQGRHTTKGRAQFALRTHSGWGS
jgi:hypothetical protein